MIPVILRGDTARGITLSPAPGYDYGGCTLEVEFNGARRAFDGLAAGEGVTLDLTADETARMPTGTGRVYMRLRNAAGDVLSLPWAKVKVTDAPGEVRAAQITIDPATLDVEDATAGDSLGAVKSKLNAVLAFLRGAAGCALLAALPCIGAEVAPLYTTPNDMPGDAPLMTNAAEYVDAKVAAATNGIADKADAAYSAAESLADGVNSLAGTVGTHTRDKNNPHKVTAAQVGALPLEGGTVTGNLTLEVGSGGSSPTLEVSGVSSSGIKLNAEYGGKITVGAGSNGGGQIVIGDSSVTGDPEAEVTIGTVKVRATLTSKADKATTLAGYGITDAATKTELNAKADKSALAAKADKSTTLAGYGITDGATKTELAALTAKVEYPLYAVPSTGVLKDRAINTTSLASVTVPDNFTDLLIRASVASSLSVTMPDAITKYGDTFPGEAGEYLITITKTGAAEAYVRTIKLELA